MSIQQLIFSRNSKFGNWQKFLIIKLKFMLQINFLDSVNGLNTRIVEFQQVLEQIKGGFWKKQFYEIKNHINNGDNKQAEEIKRGLPAFTVSANYKEARKKEHLNSYIGLLHLDYDKLDNVKEVKEKVINMPFTYAAFISPSGKGLKVFVKSDNSINDHIYAFNALRDYYDEMLGIASDEKVKDILRLCFVSYDPDLYLNEDAEVFKYQSYKKTEIKSQKDLDWVWNFTANKNEFIEGNRNSFIHMYACNANRYDFEINDVINYAYSYSDNTFSEEEIERTIKSAYENNVNEKGSIPKPAKPAKDTLVNNLVTEEKKEETSPRIPDDIYTALPLVLKDACSSFIGRERDVFLTSALSIISGGLHNVHGLYANEKVFPNLFSFIVAPPASGKGSMKYAKQLGDCYHNFLLQKAGEELKQYNKEKRLFDRKVKKVKTDIELENLIEPIKPKSSLFFIPADTSSAMLINHLDDNDGLGSICETEADTLTKTLEQDWGGYSDILRKGFQGEVISKSRITGIAYSEVKEPKFSVSITGTPNQMDSLITSIQDGLFSRFLFYSFNADPKWKNTYTPSQTVSKKDVFSEFSARLCSLFKNKNIQKFEMTPYQGGKLDALFKEALGHNIALYSEDASGVVFRLGLMSFKIAMVLTALRSDNAEIKCSDEDFNTAMYLVEKIYLKHAMVMLKKVSAKKTILPLLQQQLLKWIEDHKEFRRCEILNEANRIGIKDRTLSDILNRFLELELIEKLKHGYYIKT